eukprot:gene14568-16070_t
MNYVHNTIIAKKPAVIIGDFNIDLLQESPAKRRFSNVMGKNGYTQLIDKQTTEYKSLLDHVYTNIPSFVTSSGVIHHFSMDTSSTENQLGYIHNISPVKTSKRNHEFYDFELQVSPAKKKRVIGFNMQSHSQLLQLQESKSPVMLQNLKMASNQEDFLFNQSSRVNPASPFDVHFQYEEMNQKTGKPQHADVIAINITVESVKNMKAMQIVNVTATLSMGERDPKPVVVGSSRQKTTVKEDCVIEDPTGSSVIHIWEPFFSDVKNGETYRFENLIVKQFKGTTYLSTISTTKFSVVKQEIENIKGPALLVSPIVEVEIEEFNFVSKLTIYLSCQSCNKKIFDGRCLTKSIKCQFCGKRQRATNCTLEATVDLTINDADGQHRSLTAFTDVIAKLLKKQNITLNADSETIEEALLDLQQMVIQYDKCRGTLLDVDFKSTTSELLTGNE